MAAARPLIKQAIGLQFTHWFTLVITVCHLVNIHGVILDPTDVKVLEGNIAIFSCKTDAVPGADLSWQFKRLSMDNAREITNGDDEGRFVIGEITNTNDSVAQSLIINNTMLNDTGFYVCIYGNTSTQMGRLEVLPISWSPRCQRTPTSGRLSVGESFTLTCTSTGHENTSLTWSSVSSPAENVKEEPSSKTVTAIYTDTITTSDILFFVCESTLAGYTISERCSVAINNENQFDVIPYIVVGLMSLIALLLFFVVLLILFRHRQCRLCQEAMQEPHRVLDAGSLQTGAWVPPPVVAIDIEGSESSGDLESIKDTVINGNFEKAPSQPPDVVPVSEPVEEEPVTSEQREIEEPSCSSDELSLTVPPTEAPTDEAAPSTSDTSTVERNPKTKNRTLTKNMDQNIENPEKVMEKKAFPESRTRGSERREKKKKIKHYKEPPVKAKMKSPHKEPIYAHIKKLNVPPKSVPDKPADTPSTSTGATTTPAPELPPRPDSDTDSKETSSTATGDTNSLDQAAAAVNDLGRGNSKKKRVKHYRKKSEDIKRISNPDDVALNIPAGLSGEPADQPDRSPNEPADRIIYAELDFSKNVGLNILG